MLEKNSFHRDLFTEIVNEKREVKNKTKSKAWNAIELT